MAQIIANVTSKSKFLCPTHQHDMNYYCFDDQAVVCIYCAYQGEHSSHTCKHVEEAKKEVDTTLKKVRLSTAHQVSEMERKLQYVKDEKELLNSQEAGVHQAIEESYKKLSGILLRQKEMLFQELKDQTAELAAGVDINLQ